MTTKSSCEQGRKSAYPLELRWRVVWQYEGLNLAMQQVAHNLNVSVSTVHRIISTFRESGQVNKKKYPTGDSVRPYKLLTECVQFYILHHVLLNPSIYLWELQLELQQSLGVDISISSLVAFSRTTILVGRNYS